MLTFSLGGCGDIVFFFAALRSSRTMRLSALAIPELLRPSLLRASLFGRCCILELAPPAAAAPAVDALLPPVVPSSSLLSACLAKFRNADANGPRPVALAVVADGDWPTGGATKWFTM